MRLPADVLLGAIVRDGTTEIARGRNELRAGDHAVVFAMSSAVDDIARLFA
ncbi:MAG: TrkA C-terminal domain-containing protein [Microthrixaceae bacterium]